MNLPAPLPIATYNLASKSGAMAAQQILRNAGFYQDAIDGDFGPESQTALALYEGSYADLHEGRVFLGSNGYNFSTYISGNDLCADAVPATCFGGPTDPQDSGQTASGIIQRNHPGMLIVSLPMSYDHACYGSPWGHFFDWGTEVQIQACASEFHGVAQKVYSGNLQDVGPNSDTGRHQATANAVDLSDPIARLVAGNPAHFDANDFKMLVNVRVIGGARRLLG